MSNILIVEECDGNLESLDDLAAAGNVVDVASNFSSAMAMLFGTSINHTHNEARHHPTFPPKYDEVLSGLNLTYQDNSRAGKDAYLEAPFGLSIVFAAARARVPRIGLLTDEIKFRGRVSSSWDYLYANPNNADERQLVFENTRRPIWQINDSRVIMLDQDDVAHMAIVDHKKFRRTGNVSAYDLADAHQRRMAGSEQNYEKLRISDSFCSPCEMKDYFALHEVLKGI